jgi:hypothetical protein
MNDKLRRRLLRRSRYATAGIVLAATTGTVALTVAAAADTLNEDEGVATGTASTATPDPEVRSQPASGTRDHGGTGVTTVVPGTPSQGGSNAS